MEYPKILYKHGWDDLSDFVIVSDNASEFEAAKRGYKEMSALPPVRLEALSIAGEEEKPVKRRGRPRIDNGAG